MGVWEDVGGSLLGNADSSTLAADFARNACRILVRSTLGTSLGMIGAAQTRVMFIFHN